MGDRLKADIGRIRGSADAVEAVQREFEGADRLVGGYADAVGDAALSDKLHDFATNWKIHRDKIGNDLAVFSKWAHQAADAYETSDQQLADALKDGKPGPREVAQ